MESLVREPIVSQIYISVDSKEDHPPSHKLKSILLRRRFVSKGDVLTNDDPESTDEEEDRGAWSATVTECLPFSAGVLSEDCIVFILSKKINNNTIGHMPTTSLSPRPPIPESHSQKIDLKSLTPVSQHNVARVRPLILGSTLVKLSGQDAPTKIEIMIVDPDHPLFKMFHQENWLVESVFVSFSMLKRLRLLNQSWITLKWKQKTIISQLELCNDVEEDKLMLSDLAAFNLGIPAEQMTFGSSLFVEIAPHHANLAPSEFVRNYPLAEFVSIARVKSPAADSTVSYTSQLRKFFAQSKLIFPNQLIRFPIVSYHAVFPTFEFEDNSDSDNDTFHEEDALNNPSTTLSDFAYFRVTHIKTAGQEGCADFAVFDQTQSSKMSQQAYVSSLLPPRPFQARDHQLLKFSPPLQKLLSLVRPTFTGAGSCRQRIACSVLLSGPENIGKSHAVYFVAKKMGVHVFEINCFDQIGPTDSQTATNILHQLLTGANFAPCIVFFRKLDILTKKSANINNMADNFRSLIGKRIAEGWKEIEKSPQLVGLVAETKSLEDLGKEIRGCFRHEINFEALTPSQRYNFLLEQLQLSSDAPEKPPHKPSALSLENSINNNDSQNLSISQIQFKQHKSPPLALSVVLPQIVKLSAGFSKKDFIKILGNVGFDVFQKIKNEKFSQFHGIQIEYDDFEQAISKHKASFSASVGAPSIPKVSWKDVGGLAKAKQEILNTIQLPLDHPHLFSSANQRSGILLYGPPGTGKTLMAKAVATECSLNFLSVKGPELLNSYVGESEKNIRELFERARAAKPVVIFFDELDSLAPNRGMGADSGGVMDRIVSQLLSELDGMAKSNSVFVIGATNRPDLIDPALLRPGRFDRLVYMGIPQEKENRINILKALTRKFHLDSSINFEQLAEKCPPNLTGADFYALCSDSLLNAISERIEQIQQSTDLPRDATLRTDPVQVQQKHFLASLGSLVPSVSPEEFARYETIRRQFEEKE